MFAMTFLVRDRDGNLMPAYARFIAIPGSNALSSTRRSESEHSASNVAARIALGALGRVGSNAFTEFWWTSAISSFAESLKTASQTCSRNKKTLQASDRPSPIDHNRSLFDDLSFLRRYGNRPQRIGSTEHELERSVR